MTVARRRTSSAEALPRLAPRSSTLGRMPLTTTHKRLLAGALLAIAPAGACALIATSLLCDMGSGCHGGERQQTTAVVFVGAELVIGLLIVGLIAGAVAVRRGIQVVRPELARAEAWFITALLLLAWFSVGRFNGIVLLAMIFLAIKGNVGRRASPSGVPGDEVSGEVSGEAGAEGALAREYAGSELGRDSR